MSRTFSVSNRQRKNKERSASALKLGIDIKKETVWLNCREIYHACHRFDRINISCLQKDYKYKTGYSGAERITMNIYYSFTLCQCTIIRKHVVFLCYSKMPLIFTRELSQISSLWIIYIYSFLIKIGNLFSQQEWRWNVRDIWIYFNISLH